MTGVQGQAHDDKSVVTLLFEQHYAPLRRYALTLAHREDIADDLVADTFSRVMINLSLLAQLDDLQRRAWMYRVLRNRFVDLTRKNQRTDQMVRQLTRQITDDMEAPIIPLEWLALLDEVPCRYRELLAMRYELCMTSTEIGQKLGIPPATVRSRLRLAIQWIRIHHSGSSSLGA